MPKQFLSFLKYLETILLLSAIITMFIFLYRNLPIMSMWAFSDLLAFNHITEIHSFSSSWNSQFLGYRQETLTRASVLLLELFIRNDVISQKVYFLSILPLSVVTMYVFVRRYFKSYLSRIFSSALYAINPITIGEFVNGSVWMIIYALFPLMLHLLLKIYETDTIKNILIYGLCASILIGLSVGPIWILLWTFSPVPFVMLSNFPYFRKQKLKLYFKKSILILVFILIGFTLLLPTLYFVIFIQPFAFRPQSTASYFKDIEYCYSKATPLRLLMLAGNAGSPMDLLGYNNFTWWTISGMVIPIISFIPLINLKNSKHFFDLMLCSITCLIILFIFLTYGEITYPLFSIFTFLFSSRNPKYLMYSLSFCISFLFGRGLDVLFNLIKKAKSMDKKVKNLTFFLTLILVSISLIIYMYPTWNGDMGLGKRRNPYVVPQSYYEIASIIKERNSENDFHRVLWLPYTYQTQTRIVNTIQHFGAKLGQDVLNFSTVDFVEDFFRRIEYNNLENFSMITALFNIKYIVIDKTQNSTEPINVYKSYGTPFIKGNPELFDRFINKQHEFLKIYETNEFTIYQNTFHIPYLSIVNSTNLMEKTESYNQTNLILNGDFSENTTYWRIWIYPEDSILILNNETLTPSLLVLKSPKNVYNSVLTQKISNIIPGYQYKLSVWMKTENSRGSHVKIAWFNRDYNLTERDALRHDVLKTVIKENGSWLQFEDIFIAPKNATTAVVYLVAGPAINSSLNAKTLFANASIKKLKSPIEQIFTYQFYNKTLYLIGNLNETLFNPITNYYKDKSTFTFKVEITEPSFITMAESYNQEWVAYANKQKLTHVRAIGWANGFFISEPGKYEIKIKFKPQDCRNLMISIWLTAWSIVISTLIACTAYLAYSHTKSKHLLQKLKQKLKTKKT